MLISLSTQLGRSLRHQEIAPIFNCANLDIAIAAIQAAHAVRKGIIIYFDHPRLGNMPLPLAILYLKSLFSGEEHQITILCRLSDFDEDSLKYIAGIPNLAYALSWDRAMRTRFQSGGQPSQRVAITEELTDPEGARYLVQKCGLSAICYQSDALPYDKEHLRLIGQMTKAAKVPLILKNRHLPKWTHRHLLEARVAAVIFDDELSHAYTAGLRTTLRNRELFDPALYQLEALVAVQEMVKNYLRYPFEVSK